MWGWGRPRRNLPRVNYNDSSDDEDDFGSPIQSPNRPVNTRQGSPAELVIPQLNDNVDEDLESVRDALANIGHTHTYRGTRPQPAGREASPSPEVGDEEEVVQGLVVQEAPVANCADPAMPDDAVVMFEDEDGVDDARALQEGCRNAEKVEWDDTDVKFYFNQVETRMAAVGVKKNWTKFQILSTIIPKKVIDEVKPLLQMNEAEFPDRDAY